MSLGTDAFATGLVMLIVGKSYYERLSDWNSCDNGIYLVELYNFTIFASVFICIFYGRANFVCIEGVQGSMCLY